MSAGSLEANLEALEKRLVRACLRSGRARDEITLIAATKTVGAADIARAFDMGIRHFGENRVQEAQEKIGALSNLNPRPVWHMIGRLQSNKIKTALALFDIIQSVDSQAKAEAINRRAQKRMPVFLEINVAGEKSKAGFSPAEIGEAFPAISSLAYLDVRGLMTVAPPAEDPAQLRAVFRKLSHLRDSLGLEHLSMGMSDDFEIAVEEGATMIRIGRALFGER